MKYLHTSTYKYVPHLINNVNIIQSILYIDLGEPEVLHPRTLNLEKDLNFTPKDIDGRLTA